RGQATHRPVDGDEAPGAARTPNPEDGVAWSGEGKNVAAVLFVDVDGPLNPYAAKPQRRPDGYVTIRVPWESGGVYASRMLRVWLNPAHGPALMDLGYELCWASTWMDQANRWIGPVLGLPELPYVDFGDSLFAERPDGLHWKTERVVAYAAG